MVEPRDDAQFFNHGGSNANTVTAHDADRGQDSVVALRDIAEGEELTEDYAHFEQHASALGWGVLSVLGKALYSNSSITPPEAHECAQKAAKRHPNCRELEEALQDIMTRNIKAKHVQRVAMLAKSGKHNSGSVAPRRISRTKQQQQQRPCPRKRLVPLRCLMFGEGCAQR